ncbi:hypothetical protein LguiB_030396 [Lonicera macranthoides]
MKKKKEQRKKKKKTMMRSYHYALSFTSRAEPTFHQETQLRFNQSSLSLTAQSLTGFTRNFSNEILVGAHLRKPVNTSEKEPTKVPHAVNGNLTGFSAISSVIGVNNSISTATNSKRSENATRDSIFRGRMRKENESEVTDKEIQRVEDVIGNSPSKQELAFDHSIVKTEVSTSVQEKKGNIEELDIWCYRFNAAKLLELIRGKRLVFVGDSINRNQWESMMCLLMGAIKDPKRVYEARGRRITKEKGNYCFKFVDYKCTVEYYVTHFLVHESKARVGKKRVQTLRIDTMDRGSSRWKGADILVFNTAHWWTHFKTQAGVNYYQEGDQVHPRLDVSTAFRKALLTWSSWVDKHINPTKTQVFFRSSSPSHFRGGQWNAGGHCREATRPLNETSNTNYPEKNIIAEEVIKQMKTHVTLLNITRFSDYRIDGHPSIYGRKPGKSYSSGGQDCSHWCLPGVPDTWNELLFFHLQSNIITQNSA